MSSGSSSIRRLLAVTAGLSLVGCTLSSPVQAFGQTSAVSDENASARPVSFEQQIQPLFQKHCVECHGPDAQESHLRVDRRASLLEGGDSGEPAVLPANADGSHLLQLVTEQDSGKAMPPEGYERLTADEVRLLSDWIQQGAVWSENSDEAESPVPELTHWSFLPVSNDDPPASSDPWIINGVDAFVWQGLSQKQLHPNPAADRRQLIRRLYLDVTGLPPAPEEIDQFVAETSPDAWQNLTEHVLASPHYGERWAQYWLDLVRFSESNGFETNRERPSAWPYRDYVIHSLNEDKPYDLFLKEQLAGDLLGVPEATGFLVAGPNDIVKSPDPLLTMMQRQNELDDMIGTTGTAFLGLTLGCARCHNHKFDPVRQTDYYALQAVFAGVLHGDTTLPVPETQLLQAAQLEREILTLRTQLARFAKAPGAIRPAVQAVRNQELFTPIPAKRVRLTIRETNSSEPCLDEFEVYSGARNVALSANGTVASSSGNLAGFKIHQLKHVHDGLYGNSHSWIGNESGRGWLQLEFPETVLIDRIEWGRDREGTFVDRLMTNYEIEASVESDSWAVIASSADRQPWQSSQAAEPEYEISGAPEPELVQARKWLSLLQEKVADRDQLLKAKTVYAGRFQQPGLTYRLFRGDPTAPRESVAPDTVRVLGSLSLNDATPEQQRRMALAEWITSPDNPLTARVLVNRIWQHHFGRALVTTPSDFGGGGVRPSHPELLDWLARELMTHGWSVKHIHRLILTSATWRQSSMPRPEALQADAGTSLWWRFPPRRLDAEVVRDCILSVTGALEEQSNGPGFSAFEVQLENVRHYFPRKEFGPSEWRRMVYMTRIRQQKDAVFGAFDCPDGASSVPVRTRSTTPLQALNLFNSEFMLQQAALFAGRLQHDAPNNVGSQIRRSFQLCFGRNPEPEELSESEAFIRDEGLAAFCRVLLNSSEFLFLQ